MTLLHKDVLTRVGEPAPNWRWRCLVPDLIGTGINSSSNPILVLEVALPFDTTEQVSRFRGGANYQYTGKISNQPSTITFYESDDFRTTSYLEFWRSLAYDRSTGIYRPARSYKRDITVFLFNIADDETPMMAVRLKDCWPLGIDPFQLNYTQSGQLTVSSSFSVDETIIDHTDYSIRKPDQEI